MRLETFARTVLLGSTLEEKLMAPDLAAFTQEALAQEAHAAGCRSPQPFDTPRLPGRSAALSLDHPMKARFPELAQIHEARVRGEILHFFANHELLALELMALVLLRFPEAPAPFRQGIVRTMNEEQGHLRLYLSRMKELGVEFGDLPVSGYFWNVLSSMRSPLEFVTQMSLTFEQANLDFSLFYRDEVAKTGDILTTQVLDQVYREEIGHVKHGLEWFNRWRAQAQTRPEESDWDAYRRLLPPPLTPRRAKGVIFDIAARRQAGFSEEYIRELEIFSGAKGRPPVLWLYNPFCDAEIARGKPGFSPKTVPRRLSEDLEHFPMFLASPQDIVLTSKRPGLQWLSSLKRAGFEIPEWAEPNSATLREPKFGGFEPWGWSPESFEFFRPLQSRLAMTSGGNARWCQTLFSAQDFKRTGLSAFFSKSWSVEFLRNWLLEHPEHAHELQCDETVGQSLTRWPEAKAHLAQKLQNSEPMIAKAPWSTSGNGVRRILNLSELDGALGGWIENTIASQGSIVIEPWLERLHDLSIQLEIESDYVRVLEARKFLTGNQFEYRGTCLGPLRSAFDPESLRAFQERLPIWKTLARDLGRTLQSQGYEGPVGIDALLYRSSAGDIRLKPVVEINPRWTMGRVALALEKRVLPGIPALWLFLPLRELKALGFASATDAVNALNERFPLETASSAGSLRISSGVIPTQDPQTAREVLSLLVVGDEAIQANIHQGR